MASSAPPEIDAAFIDMGGVLLGWDPVRLYEGLLGDRAAAEALVVEIDLYAWNWRADLGEPYAELIPRWQARYPHRAAEIAAYRERWADTLTGATPGTAEVVDDVRAAGVPVVLLSNTSAETFPLCREVAPVLSRLDGLVVSGAEGVAKPDRAIYELALSRFGFDAPRTAFIDDRPENVAAAADIGLQAVAFTDAGTLREDLQARGLDV